MAEVSRRLLFGAIATRLITVTNAIGYYGQIGRPLTSPAPDGWAADPPPKSDTDLRVKPYFILFPGPGTDGPDTDLGDCAVDGLFSLQVTVAGGDIEDVLALVDRVSTALRRWAPAVSGLVCGPLRYPDGYSPGPVLVDREQTPPRLYVPLPFQLTVTAS